MAIASVVFCQPRPSAEITVSASRIAGNANSTSMSRPTTGSTQPPEYPALMPRSVPSTAAIATETTATRSEVKMPTATRAATSRPNWSVPNQYRPDGA